MTIPGGKGMLIQGLWFLSPQEVLDALQRSALLIDLRSDELFEMKAFGVPECIHLPLSILADHAGELPRDRLLILADTAGVYTKGAARMLEDLGFGQIACLNGGMVAWDQEGFPVSTDHDALLHGGCACVMRSRKDRATPS
jgi:rhodanese-related sulfurtransferase